MYNVTRMFGRDRITLCLIAIKRLKEFLHKYNYYCFSNNGKVTQSNPIYRGPQKDSDFENTKI